MTDEDVVCVTADEVAAAKLEIRILERLGRPVAPRLHLIANALPARPEPPSRADRGHAIRRYPGHGRCFRRCGVADGAASATWRMCCRSGWGTGLATTLYGSPSREKCRQ